MENRESILSVLLVLICKSCSKATYVSGRDFVYERGGGISVRIYMFLCVRAVFLSAVR